MDKLFDLSGRVILVTGSTSGIGLALATGYANRGARVVLNGRRTALLEEHQARFRAQGLTAEIAAFDVTQPQAVQEAVSRIEAEIGPISVLVNNAGMQHRAPLQDFPDEAWQAMMTTNISSVFYVAKAVARGMIARGAGKMINIASVTSELARPSIAPYTASKGAVKQLTRGMCADWARHGLQINAIAPGYFKTPLNAALIADTAFNQWITGRTPAGRWGELDELIGAAVFLASDASSFVNGQVLYVDGGISVTL